MAASVPNLNNKSPHNKRRGLSETPEIQRKSRKLFAARTRDVDKLDQEKSGGRKRRSLTNPRSSIDESESSRKSSMSSGRNKRNPGGSGGAGKQFAVTLLVNEHDKTKIMDMLYKAKQVISRKVEKVIGRKPPKSEISNADALRTVLENWVEDAEQQEKDDDYEEKELIEAQEAQVASWKSQGYEAPVQIRPIPTTIVSPVPEEEDIEESDEDETENNDIEVQEVLEGQTSFLLPPRAQKFKLERTSVTPPMMSPTRSLTPCENVPRPVFVARQEDFYKLRRPSSHYDANAQAACSRPTSRQDSRRDSRQDVCLSPTASSTPMSPSSTTLSPSTKEVFDYTAFAMKKAFQDQENKMKSWFDEEDENEEEMKNADAKWPGSKIQRPESMVIPVGGVWRPDEDQPVSLFDEQQTETEEQSESS